VQLKFNFSGKTEIEMLWDELLEAESKLNNLRRGLFKRYNELDRKQRELDSRLKAIEQPCKFLPLFDSI